MSETFDCYTGPGLRILDVSHHQPTIDWREVAAYRWMENGHEQRIVGSFIRALEGTTRDEMFPGNWHGAKAAGLVVGPYSYFRARHSGKEQIAALAAVLKDVGGLRASDMPPLCDMETLDELSRDVFLARVHEWVDACRNTLHRAPWMYSGAFWHGYVASPAFKSLPLVTPDYRSATCARVPRGWDHWTMHQFTSRADIPGIRGNVDMSIFRGDERALARLIAKSRVLPLSWWAVGMSCAMAIGCGIGYGVSRVVR